jgi:hypothetical protein
MIAIPGAIKHDRAATAELAEAHLATGRNAYRFAVNKLGFFDELFLRDQPDDIELQRIRAIYQLLAARTALRLGDRDAAGKHLREASRGYSSSWDIMFFRFLAAAVPSGASASTIHELIWRAIRRVRTLNGGKSRTSQGVYQSESTAGSTASSKRLVQRT